MKTTDPREAELLEDFRELSERRKRSLCRFAQRLAEITAEERTAQPEPQCSHLKLVVNNEAPRAV